MRPAVRPFSASVRLRPEQLEHELDLAREVQRSLFPTALPELPGVALAAVNHPARIVSGDLYDVIKLDPERVAILCADVSGKGFAAALLAAEVHAYVRSTLRAACVYADASLGPLPVQVIALLNDESTRREPSGRYATMFFAEFDANERVLQYVNAGHNPPLLFAADGRITELSRGGPPVGLFADASYEAGIAVLSEHDTLVVYTDGVVEARNLADEEFGLGRMIEACASRSGDVVGVLAVVMEAVRAWSEGTEQGDDITLVALSIVPGESSGSQ